MRFSHIHLLDYAALEDARPLGARTARRALGALVAALVAWHRVVVERRQLLSFSDRDLRDLALSRVDAVRVADAPVWPSVREAALAAWRGR